MNKFIYYCCWVSETRIYKLLVASTGSSNTPNLLTFCFFHFRFGKEAETESKVAHNERLEFLGDAVVEFITSVHLFHMFPDLEEGGLATYR